MTVCTEYMKAAGKQNKINMILVIWLPRKLKGFTLNTIFTSKKSMYHEVQCKFYMNLSENY